MTVVLDSTILIDHLRGSRAATDFIAGLDASPTCSEVTRIEVVQGLRAAEKQAAAQVFDLLEWVPLDDTIARRAGELGRRWRRSHPGIDIADLAIAATAELLEAQLATLNLKHFPMFESLRAPY
jgi:predicted nucleic acid-binding protein